MAQLLPSRQYVEMSAAWTASVVTFDGMVLKQTVVNLPIANGLGEFRRVRYNRYGGAGRLVGTATIVT
jgi:hypothetical protein